MPSDITVTICGERGDEWERATGARKFPVRCPLPHLGKKPDGRGARFYELDLDAVAPALMSKILDHLAEKFTIDHQDIYGVLKRDGVSILADDCIVTIRNPQKWF